MGPQASTPSSEQQLQERELLRLELMVFLYKERPRPHPEHGIITAMAINKNRGLSCAEAVKAELQFLTDKGFVTWKHSELGATKMYRLLAEGVLFMEREYPLLIVDQK
jgi:hypothetical protein